MANSRIKFLPGVSAEHVMQRLKAAGGKEVESGKFVSPDSSAALAVNCFGWFIDRPELLPVLPGLQCADWPATRVDVEYCARFPWRGGRHPWLDAVVQTSRWLIGVESKRYEPFRDRKSVSLSDAYDRPVWGANMEPYERMRDSLRAGAIAFEYLNAAQLVKHAFGLVTDAGRSSTQPALVYLFAEPSHRGGQAISPEALTAHRREIATFADAVSGAEVRFAALSYRDWLANWSDGRVAAHRDAILAAFNP